MAHDHLVCPPPVSPEIIRHAVWLYALFTLSYRDVEDLLAERGLDVSDETVRRWVLKFGPLFARELRGQRPRPTSTWHLDEMAVVIAGRQFWLWRAVDDEGEVLDLLVQRRCDKATARGVAKFAAVVAAGSPTGLWRMSGHPAVQQALRNDNFESLGLPRIYAPAQA